MISMHCPHCHEALNIPEQYAGQSGACKKCGARIQVPATGDGTQMGQPAPVAGAPQADSDLGLPDDLTAALEASFSRKPATPVVVAPSLGDRLQPMLKPLGLVLGVVVVIAAVAAGLPHLSGLQIAQTPSPEEVTRGFMEAMKTGNVQQWKPYVTEKSWALLGQAPATPADVMAFDSYTVGVATTTGSTAQVPLQITQFGITVSNDVLLRQEAGNWRVYALKMSLMPGMNMTMNFEEPEAILDDLNEMMQGMPPEVMQQMEEAMRQQGGFQ